MDRRTLLAGLGTATGVALAGCSTTLGGSTLDDPEVQAEADETHLHYADGQGEIATTSVLYGPVEGQTLVGVQVSIWHRAGTTLTDLGLVLRDRDPTAVRPDVYVGGFSGEFPPVSFTTGPRREGRAIEVPDVEAVGEGTVTLDLYVRRFGDWPLQMAVDVNYELDTGLAQSATVEGTVDFEIQEPGGAGEERT